MAKYCVHAVGCSFYIYKDLFSSLIIESILTEKLLKSPGLSYYPSFAFAMKNLDMDAYHREKST